VRTRLTDLLGIRLPIVQAPMAGAQGASLAVAIAGEGALGSVPCAMLTEDGVRAEVETFRAATGAPLNLNFFCHAEPERDPERMRAWLAALAPYSDELGVELAGPTGPGRAAFDSASCELVERLRPEVVSFHFGLPEPALVERVRATGARILSSATTVDEARWLADHGCDAVIAQGAEAGGHRGMFRTDRLETQVGTIALVPQVVDAVPVPVIAAGGIADARGIAAALALGADGVQIGTAFLPGPEAIIGPLHRAALERAADTPTALTNVFTGRPARGLVNRVMRELGPMSGLAPPFPLPAAVGSPLRAAAERAGSGDFSPLWAGQAAPLARPLPAAELVRTWAAALGWR
jgi:nitronate monooxygenase